MAESETQAVSQILTDWTDAISRGDRQAILARHDKNLLMFDFPNTVEGIDAYAQTWNFFYENPRGPITFAPSDIKVVAGADVAFASCMIHCDGTSAGPLDLRLTMGLEKRNGEWIIIHEHHSVPATEDRYIDDRANAHGMTTRPH